MSDTTDDMEALAGIYESYMENIDDEDIWIDNNGQYWDWEDIKTSHLRNIVRRIESGKSIGGQAHKLKRAKRELAIRESKEESK